MAGNYMNAPADRLAYDLDGSVLSFFSASNALTQMTATKVSTLNSETETVDASAVQAWGVVAMFPIPMDISAFFFTLGGNPSNVYFVQTSKNSTNGVDGTWTTQGAAFTPGAQTKPNYRVLSNLITLPGGSANQGLRGIRIVNTTTPTNVNWNTKTWHLYGEPSASATKDRLAFWHPTSNTLLSPTYFDFGNTPRGSTGDVDFRIKNLSTTLTATDIDVYVDAPTPGVPSVASFLTFSTDGKASFSPSFDIPSLGPGEISPVYTLRRVTPTNAQISVWSARINTEPQSWS